MIKVKVHSKSWTIIFFIQQIIIENSLSEDEKFPASFYQINSDVLIL